MKTRAHILLFIVTLLCLVGWTGHGQKKTPEQTRWEYKAVGLSTAYPDEKALNSLGSQGWELVGVSDVSGGTYYLFKRGR